MRQLGGHQAGIKKNESGGRALRGIKDSCSIK